MVSHTTIVFTRYITLEWRRCSQNDQKTYGELFYMFCDDIQDMDLTKALQSLMALFVNITTDISAEITSMIKVKYLNGCPHKLYSFRLYLVNSAGKVE
ncbi:MAG: hypothetical protein K2N85_01515 [Lachnospiraceae bacterium]|nr:hypothetical protein [Lachnospiraceae bacterium]